MSVTAQDMLSDSRTPRRPSTARPAGIVGSIAWLVETWRTRVRDRQALASLDYRDLRDLRLSQWEVEREMAKPFWWD